MRWKNILEDRDRSIETQLLQALGASDQENKNKIHDAIKRGAEQYMRDYLPILAGEATNRIKKEIEDGDI